VPPEDKVELEPVVVDRECTAQDAFNHNKMISGLISKIDDTILDLK
jgi:hypothetical protein